MSELETGHYLDVCFFLSEPDMMSHLVTHRTMRVSRLSNSPIMYNFSFIYHMHNCMFLFFLG